MNIIVPYCNVCKDKTVFFTQADALTGDCHSCKRKNIIIKNMDVKKMVSDEDYEIVKKIYDLLGIDFPRIISSISKEWVALTRNRASAISLFSEFRWAKKWTTNKTISDILWYDIMPRSLYTPLEIYHISLNVYTWEIPERARQRLDKNWASTKLLSSKILWIVRAVIAIDCKPMIDLLNGKDIAQEDEWKVDEVIKAGIDSGLYQYIITNKKLDYEIIKPILEYWLKQWYNTSTAGMFKWKFIVNIPEDITSHLPS